MTSATRKTTVFITGCTPGGIGHALAVEFHRRGCHVIATARNRHALESLSDLGMSAVQLDVTDAASVSTCKAEVVDITGGRLDVLVNNAGRTYVIPALDMSLDDVCATYEANVFGVMLMCQAFASLLIPARGLIVNVSSASSLVPYLFGAIYSSTKGAVNVYSRALRMELRPFHVRVMVAMTGTVRSNITSHPNPSLPPGSLYMPAQDFFERRLKFSQTNATMPIDVYAHKLVSAALRGEPHFWGLVGGTPDYLWAGGMSSHLGGDIDAELDKRSLDRPLFPHRCYSQADPSRGVGKDRLTAAVCRCISSQVYVSYPPVSKGSPDLFSAKVLIDSATASHHLAQGHTFALAEVLSWDRAAIILRLHALGGGSLASSSTSPT